MYIRQVEIRRALYVSHTLFYCAPVSAAVPATVKTPFCPPGTAGFYWSDKHTDEVQVQEPAEEVLDDDDAGDYDPVH
jgi:hypothetical protein